MNDDLNGTPYRKYNLGNGALRSPFDAALNDEKRKYKEDLDYLIYLRRRMGEEEFNARYGNYFNDLKRRYETMNEQYYVDQNDNKNFKKYLMREYENEIFTNKDKERTQKQVELQQDKKYLERLEYQNFLDNQRKVENKIKLKNENIREMDYLNQKKHLEGLQKFEDQFQNKKLINEESKRMEDREHLFKNKINIINEKIYDNVLKHNGYINNSMTGSPKMSEPFYVKNDSEFNRRVGEMKAYERDILKKDPNMVSERLRDLEKLRNYENKQKIEKVEHQKLYKDYLDNQTSYKVEKSPISGIKYINEEDSNQPIMPGYHYPKRPVATTKKAIDSINWVKNNHVETLHNGYRVCNYIGDTNLRHNPIVQPLDNNEYNRYLNKQRQFYGHGDVGRNNSENSSKTLANVGNSIIA